MDAFSVSALRRQLSSSVPFRVSVLDQWLRGSGWLAPDVVPNQGKHPVPDTECWHALGIPAKFAVPDYPIGRCAGGGLIWAAIGHNRSSTSLNPANDVGGGGRGSPRGSLGLYGSW